MSDSTVAPGSKVLNSAVFAPRRRSGGSAGSSEGRARQLVRSASSRKQRASALESQQSFGWSTAGNSADLLAYVLPYRLQVLVTGGSGFIGIWVRRLLCCDRCECCRLTAAAPLSSCRSSRSASLDSEPLSCYCSVLTPLLVLGTSTLVSRSRRPSARPPRCVCSIRSF
jgi:hypothetical protein